MIDRRPQSVIVEVSNVDIGQNVQRARYLRGLTQIDVAAAIGVDRTAVSRIEAGTRSVAATELLALAELLAVPIAELLKAAPAPPRCAETAAARPEAPLPITSTSKEESATTSEPYQLSSNFRD